jgi:hypothetical protein
MKTDSLISARWLAVGLGVVLIWFVATVWSAAQWPWNLAQAAIFLLVTAISVLVLSGKFNAKFRWILVPFITAVCWGPVQIWLGISIYRYATWTAALAWASYAGALWIALNVFVHADIARKFRAAAVVFAVAVAVEAPSRSLRQTAKSCGSFQPGVLKL